MVHPLAFAPSSTLLGIDVSPVLIEALDNGIREELQRTSHQFFIWVLISAIVVAIGVALEGPEILHEMWPRLFSWFTWPSDEHLQKFERAIKTIGLWGWLLVVVGVMGEGVFEGLQNRADGQLQTFNDVLLKDARVNAVTAKQSATDAAGAAATAKIDADNAGSKAAQVERSMRATEKEATELQTRIDDLHARIAWRTISDGQKKKISEELQAFRGRTIVLRWSMSDPEPNTFAPQLLDAFQAAGLAVNAEPSGFIMLDPSEMSVLGLEIKGNDSQFMNSVAKSLVCSYVASFPVPFVADRTTGNAIVVVIRPKGEPVNKRTNDSKCLNNSGTVP